MCDGPPSPAELEDANRAVIDNPSFETINQSTLTHLDPVSRELSEGLQQWWKEERDRGIEDPGAEARAIEAARRARITQSVDEINKAFDKFNPEFYGGISRAYLDYYKPQLNEQAAAARRRLILSNPSAGSSAFARKA